MGETAAGLILAEPATGNTTGNTTGNATGNATEPDRDPEPRVIPVPGEVILRESTLPHPPAL
jgi:hypothetical protein